MTELEEFRKQKDVFLASCGVFGADGKARAYSRAHSRLGGDHVALSHSSD